MVKNCCVLGCTSNTKRNPAISFFRFPTDTTLASMWLQLIGRPDFKPSQYSVICQLHFTRDDFTSGSHHYPITGIGGQRKRLKTKAIPTQNLNGCTNPELLAEIQMRAKNTIPQKPVKSLMGAGNTMVNTLAKSNEAVQLQQLLTSLMPALFGNDGSNGDSNNNNSHQTQISLPQQTQQSTINTTNAVFTSQNGTMSASSTPATVATQGPIISIPSTLQSIQLGNATLVQATNNSTNNNILQPAPAVHEAIMSTPLVKNETQLNGDHSTIFKISNGGSLSNGILNHNNNNSVSNNTSNNTHTTFSRNNCSVTDDLYTELQNSLLALKNNMVNENQNNTNVIQVQQPARETPMDTTSSNPAYIIDVDTYQKLMETVSQKSEKCSQTEKDLTIFTLETENKQLKEQLSQYELAFNSLLNWTEGSLKTDPVAPPTSENKLVEGKLIE